MAVGQKGFHRYLKQQRAMGRSEPTREDKAAYLQGDIQARLAMSNQMRQTGIQERAQQAQEGQFAQSLAARRSEASTAKKQWERGFALQEDQAKQQERWNKLRGIGEIAKLGMEAAPMLGAAGKWAYGKMGGDGGGYAAPSYAQDYTAFDARQGYPSEAGQMDYNIPDDYSGFGGYSDYGGAEYVPPQEFDYDQYDFDDSAGWMDF